MNRRLNLKRELDDGGIVEADSDDERSGAGAQAGASRRRAAAAGGAAADAPSKRARFAYVNKQRCLVFASRGLTSRFRHLMEDVRALLPHHKKEVKLDTKDSLNVINEIAEVKTCNTTLYFECKKKADLYLWVSRTPHGPSAKFLVQNVHTMDELKLTGNCLKGSRALLNFDESFDTVPHLQVLRELFTEVFGTPRGHPKSKPFIDRVMSFFWVDGRVWVRNYQITDQADTAQLERSAARRGEDLTQLAEIGPRFVLNLVRVFAGSFGGQTLYQNPEFISPNMARRMRNEQLNSRYVNRKAAEERRQERREELVVPEDHVASVFRDASLAAAAGAGGSSGESSDEEDL